MSSLKKIFLIPKQAATFGKCNLLTKSNFKQKQFFLSAGRDSRPLGKNIWLSSLKRKRRRKIIWFRSRKICFLKKIKF